MAIFQVLGILAAGVLGFVAIAHPFSAVWCTQGSYLIGILTMGLYLTRKER